MVIVPYGHDQPDNAIRVSKLGISGTVGRQNYSADVVATALNRLIGNADAQMRAERIGEIVKREDGAAAAADAIERAFNRV
jgi:UDP:flavonoid glycosyltransferase YjiC (YdhE family)